MSDRPVINPSFRKAFSQALDEARRRHGWDWRQLAASFGLTESLISLYRSGARYPSWRTTLDIDSKEPGFAGRLVMLYYRFEQQDKARQAMFEADRTEVFDDADGHIPWRARTAGA